MKLICCVRGQISDVKKDRGMIHSIVDRSLPDGFHLSNLSSVPGVVTSPCDSKVREGGRGGGGEGGRGGGRVGGWVGG